MDSALEDINNPESDVPELAAALYTNDAGDTCTEISMTKDEEAVNFVAAASGSVTTVTASILGQANILLVLDDANRDYSMAGNFAASGVGVLEVNGSLKGNDDRTDLVVAVSVPVGESGITFTLKGAMTHEAPAYEAGQDLNIVAYEDLLAENMEGETAQALSTEMSAGVFGILGAILQAYPEIMTMGTDSGTVVEETVPAE